MIQDISDIVITSLSVTELNKLNANVHGVDAKIYAVPNPRIIISAPLTVSGIEGAELQLKQQLKDKGYSGIVNAHPIIREKETVYTLIGAPVKLYKNEKQKSSHGSSI